MPLQSISIFLEQFLINHIFLSDPYDISLNNSLKIAIRIAQAKEL